MTWEPPSRPEWVRAVNDSLILPIAEVAALPLARDALLAEARATFARLRRDRTLTPAKFLAVKRDFDGDWARLAIIEPTAALCRAAGELAERYRLRGCDSIQLATFLDLVREDARSEIRFSSFDRQLNLAATRALRAATRRG